MGRGKLVVGLGAFVLGVMGLGIWLVLSGGQSVTQDTDDGDEVASTERPSEADATAAKKDEARRSRKAGKALIFGEVKFKKDEKPAAGQRVLLLREGGAPWEAITDEKGGFRFEKLPRGGPYEVRVEAEGFATVRVPGIALDRREERKLDTLWLDVAVSLTVYVKDYGDKPIEGAEVEAFATSYSRGFDWTKQMAQIGVAPVAIAAATTDAEGKVFFPELATGSYTVAAFKEGYARDGRSTPNLSSKQEPKPVTIYLGSAFSLSGRVLGHDDKTIPGALVMASSSATQGWDLSKAPLYARVTSDENGLYRFDNLASGDTGIWAARPGGAPARLAVIRIPAVTHFDVFLKAGGTLKGRVTDSETAKPIAEATVTAQGWYWNNTRVAQAVTDEQGNYVIDTLLEGQINSLKVEKEGYVQVREPGQQQWQQIPLNRDDTIVRDLKMRQAASLTGTVTGPDGELLDGATVNAYVMQPGGNWDNRNGTTDAQGKFRFDSVNAGKVLLQVSKKGYYQKGFPTNYWMAIQQGTTPKQYTAEVPEKGEAVKDIQLTKGAVVEGRVEAQDGSAIVDAKVAGGGGSATTDQEGKFRMEGVKPGPKISVYANKEGFTRTNDTVEVLEDQPTTDVLLRMNRAGKVTGTITSARTKDLRDAYVRIRKVPKKQNRQPWQMQQEERQWNNAPRAPVRPDGTYEIDMNVSEGSFVIRATAIGHETLTSEPVAVVPGQESYQVDLMLREGSTLRGRVLKTDTADGIPGARLTVTKSQRNQQRFYGGWQQQKTIVAVTDSSGAYEIAHLGEGKYTVEVEAEGYVTGKKSVKIPGIAELDISIEPELEITGFVKLSDGSPVENAQVAAIAVKKKANTSFNPYNQQRNVISGSDGGFRIGALTSGDYRIKISPSWNSTTNVRDHTSEPFPAGSTGIEVMVEPGLTIRGKVVGPDGKGLAGLWINAQLENAAAGKNLWRNAQTGEGGVFEIVGLIDGTYKVMLQTGWGGGGEANQYQGAQKTGVNAGETDLTIKLEPGLSIEGRLSDSSGKAVPDKTLWAQYIRVKGDQSQPSNVVSQNKQAMTDSDGKFMFQGLSAGKYRISFQQQWMGDSGAATGEVVIGGESVGAGSKGVQLSLSAGMAIEGIVVDENGDPIARTNVSAKSSDNAGQAKSARTGDDGTFEIKGLLPQVSYTLTASRTGLKQTSVTDVQAGSTDVRVVMFKGKTITGRLLDASGNPIASRYIQLHNKELKSRSGGSTNEAGEFEISGLEEAAYDVSTWRQVENDDGATQWKQVQLGVIDAPGKDIELRMPSD